MVVDAGRTVSLANSYSSRISSLCYFNRSSLPHYGDYPFPSAECWRYTRPLSWETGLSLVLPDNIVLWCPWESVFQHRKQHNNAFAKFATSFSSHTNLLHPVMFYASKFFHLASHPIRFPYHRWLHRPKHSSLPSNILPALQNCTPRQMQQLEIAG